MIKELLSSFYPELCPGCLEPVVSGEKIICTSCLIQLPLRRNEQYLDPVMMRNIDGRLFAEQCFSMLRFIKGNVVQHLLHALKYERRADIGVFLGRMAGFELAGQGHLTDYNCIVPVPLHRSKLKSRGYNQSERFSHGLSEALYLPVIESGLKRVKKGASQTNKSRLERFMNVDQIFISDKMMQGMSVLLVDDVFTTGATLEACGTALLGQGVERISVMTIARAEL